MAQTEKNCTQVTVRPLAGSAGGKTLNITCLGRGYATAIGPRKRGLSCVPCVSSCVCTVGAGYGRDYAFTVETCATIGGSLHCFKHRGNDTFAYPVRIGPLGPAELLLLMLIGDRWHGVLCADARSLRSWRLARCTRRVLRALPTAPRQVGLFRPRLSIARCCPLLCV